MSEIRIEMQTEWRTLILQLEHYAEQWGCELKPLNRGMDLLSELPQEYGAEIRYASDGMKTGAVEDSRAERSSEAGYIMLPEFMMRIHGVRIVPSATGIVIERDEEATTWEDYVQTKLAHLLAERYNGTMYYDGGSRPVEIDPAAFETFDHYVETVVSHVPDVLKETKKFWLYAHRKRSLR